MSVQSRHSARSVPTHRSKNALAFGARIGVRTILMPSKRSTWSNGPVNLVSRSWIRNLGGSPVAAPLHLPAAMLCVFLPNGVNPREDGGRFWAGDCGHQYGSSRNPKGGIPVSFTTYLAPDPSEISRARRFIRQGCEATYLRPEAVDGIVLAVSEACANAVQYAGASKVKVTWDRAPEGMVVEVADDG